MTEFIPTLIAGIMIFIIAALMVSVPPASGISGAVIANNPNYFLITDSTYLRVFEKTIMNETFTINKTNGHTTAFDFNPNANDYAFIKLEPSCNGANINVKVNGVTAYSGKAENTIEMELNKSTLDRENEIETSIESASWEFWASPECKIKTSVSGLVKYMVSSEFAMNKPKDAIFKMYMTSKPEGELTIMLNGKQFFSGRTGEYLELEVPKSEFKEHNIIELIPSNDGFFAVDYAELVFK